MIHLNSNKKNTEFPDHVQPGARSITDIFKNDMILSIEGVQKRLINVRAASLEAGTKLQITGTLQSATGDSSVEVRIKKTYSNEARIYQKIPNDLKNFTPTFYAAFDEQGNIINNCMASGDPVFIMLENLAPASTTKINDFKFCKSHLVLRNKEEYRKHHQRNIFNIVIYIIYYIKSLTSRFSFSLSASKKGFLGRLKQIHASTKTKSVLKEIIERLSTQQKELFIDKLKNLQTTIHNGSIAFSDASLLFISKQIDGEEELDIRLIDLAHGITEDENFSNFITIKNDIIQCIEDLIRFSNKSHR